MPPRLFSRDSSSTEQQLPFTGDTTNESDFAQDQSHAENGAHTLPRRIRGQPTASSTLSSSYTRNPIRSFAHQTSHGFAGAYLKHGHEHVMLTNPQIPRSTHPKVFGREALSWHRMPSKPKITKTGRTDIALPRATHLLRDMVGCCLNTMADGRQ
jgi:hypothetical protein